MVLIPMRPRRAGEPSALPPQLARVARYALAFLAAGLAFVLAAYLAEGW